MTSSATLGNDSTDLWIQSTHGQMFVRSWFPEAGALRPNCAPILLLHESLGCIEQWKDFPSALAQATGRTVVAYDRLGFGRSDRLTAPPAPTFVEDEAAHGFACVLKHLDIERFVVLGHSVGGSMAVHCAAQYPEACQAMITMSAVTFVEARTPGKHTPSQSLVRRPCTTRTSASLPWRPKRLGAQRLDRHLARPGLRLLDPRPRPARRTLPGTSHPWRHRRIRLRTPPPTDRPTRQRPCRTSTAARRRPRTASRAAGASVGAGRAVFAGDGVRRYVSQNFIEKEH